MWKKVKVQPWVGSLYDNNTLLPFRTLVLGESNYTEQVYFNKNLVINCIQEHLGENEDKNFSRFATKIRRVVLGRYTKVSAKEFWESVAFCNFIQHLVGGSSKERPTQEMWNESASAFEEIIELLKPERVLVLGKENWNNLLSTFTYEFINDYKALLSIGGERVLAGFIVHPSSGGGLFTYKKFEPIARSIVLDSVE